VNRDASWNKVLLPSFFSVDSIATGEYKASGFSQLLSLSTGTPGAELDPICRPVAVNTNDASHVISNSDNLFPALLFFHLGRRKQSL